MPASASNAAFRTQSAAVLPSLAPHDSKARLLDVSNRRDSWRSHVHRTYIAQRVQFFKLQTANVNFLWEGLREGYLFLKKRYPSLIRIPASGGGNLLSAPAQKTLFLFLSLQLRKLFFLELAIRHLTD